MTLEEIIKAKEHFQYGINCDMFSEPVTFYAKTAVESLEKQTPKKVNKFFKAPDGYLSNGDCPSCKERVDEGTMYCEACGQAIDWSDKR